jgi:hypothetical protein
MATTHNLDYPTALGHNLKKKSDRYSKVSSKLSYGNALFSQVEVEDVG